MATLSSCQDALDLLNELVEEGYGIENNDFQYCQLRGAKFLVGNSYDSSEFEIV